MTAGIAQLTVIAKLQSTGQTRVLLDDNQILKGRRPLSHFDRGSLASVTALHPTPRFMRHYRRLDRQLD